MTANNDSDDLEALFDSVSEQTKAAAPAPAPEVSAPSGAATGDSGDLQALFDEVSASAQVAPPAAPSATHDEEWSSQETVFNRVGQMARQLHDTFHELGYDKVLENSASAIPDARERLAYVANLTEQAACKVLNATDVAKPAMDEIENQAQVLGDRWDKLFNNQLSTAEFRQLAEETRGYLKASVPTNTAVVNQQLMEIMLAQDFQDLTGQVIKKIVSLAQDLEEGLMTVLLTTVPDNKRSHEVDSLMNGPVINADGRSDVVVNQQQVDDLLDSLGF